MLTFLKANDDLDLELGYVSEESDLIRCANRGTDRVNQHARICMVPSVLKEKEKYFKPRVVSIGPLHKQDKYGLELEGLKVSYLGDLLGRSGRPEEMLKLCLEKVKTSIRDIKSSYPAKITKSFSDSQLATMMVLDGCFILEFCFKMTTEDVAASLNKLQITCIAIDLMLLENQIPFFVLRYIFDLITKPSSICTLSLTSLIHKVLSPYIHPFDIPFPDFCVTDVSKDSNHAHVLDCMHKIYQFKPSEYVGDDGETSLKYNHSVVELDRAGVKFKPQKEKNKGMSMNIEKSISRAWYVLPWRKRTLVMPTLVIQESTEVVLRNFIAYEQISPQVNYYFTSYASAMDMLIDNKADVGKLVESKVIVNNLGSNKKVADTMNGICQNIEITGFCYTKQINELDKYYESRWPGYLAYLKRTYFNNPWTVIALFAGIILFGLNVLQAVLRIMNT